jgi:hypothetical protein
MNAVAADKLLLLRQLGLSDELVRALEVSPGFDSAGILAFEDPQEITQSLVTDSADFHLTLSEPPLVTG